MGLLDLFSKDKRDDRARSKNLERAVNKNAQSLDRLRALEALAADGSDEALYGLLRRFGFSYHKTIEDEQEKDWVFDTLVEKGKAILPAVQRYLVNADSISWPLRLLEKIADADETLAALKLVAEKNPPGYERDPSKKIQFLHHLGHFKHPESPALAAPYLGDMDEGVRFATIETLMEHKNEALSREPLLALLISDEEESRRIRLKICEFFAERGWPVGDKRPAVEKKLPEPYQLDRDGHIKRKA
ncbi:MAG TPA: HEAT repeat domain-containing protein [Polyangia bacterium]